MKVGAVFAELTAKTQDFTSQMDRAGNTLDQFGSKGKRLQDQLANLERQKQSVNQRLEEMTANGKTAGTAFDNLSNRSANLSDRISTQKLRMSELASTSSNSNNILNSLQNTMSNLGSVFGRTTSMIGSGLGSIANIGTSAFSSLFSSIQRIAEYALGTLLANAIQNTIGKLKDLASSFFVAGAETEKQGVAFEVLTGSMENAAKLMEQVNNLALKSNFKVDELRNVTKQMLSFGFSQENVIPTMKMLGDITAGTGGDLTLLARAYGQVKTKGKLFAQELNQLGEQGLAVRDILAKELGITVEDLMVGMENKKINVPFEKLEEVMKRLHQEKFFDLMARQADTAKGRFDNLTEGISLVGQEIIGIDTITGRVKPDSLFDNVSKALGTMLQYLNDNKKAIQEFLGQGLNKLIVDVKSFVKDGLPKLLDFFGKVKNKFDEISPVAVKFGQDLVYVFQNPLEIAQKIWGGFITFIQPVIDKFNEIVNVLKTYFAPELAGIQTVIQTLTPVFQSLGMFLGGLATFLLYFGTQILAGLKYAWDVLREPVMKLVEALAQVLSVVMPVIMAVVALAAGIITVLMPVIQVLWAVIVQAFSGILQIITGVLNLVVGLIKSVFGIIYGIFTGDFSIAVEGFKLLWEGLLGFIRGVATFILSPVKGIVDGIQNFFKGIDLFKIGVDMITGLVNGIKSMIGGLNKMVTDTANGIADGFKNALGIHSPSKVFEMFGKYTAQGYQQGVEGQTVQTAQATAGMASSATAGAVSVNQSNAININGSQNPNLIMQEVKKFLATQNNLAFNGVL